jgi:carbonic anhydrase/acetyltransferase-like protein (isoleucine patch superfamily)
MSTRARRPIGDDVSIGHNAVVHGCTIGDGSLIGMGAVVLNGP